MLRKSQTPVYDKNNPDSIRLLFDDIANRYDLGNSFMSMNMHRLWNKKLIKTLLEKRTVINYLDLCSGTGDIAFRLLKDIAKESLIPSTHLLDFSSEMLDIAKKRAYRFCTDTQQKIYFHEGIAEKLAFASASFDTISIAYGVRNINYLQDCLNECYRVLQTGGKIAILELTRPKRPLLRFLHRIYLKAALPVIGKICTSNKAAYDYLQGSIESFICPETLMQMMREAGFVNTEAKELFGGIATIFTAKKVS